MAMANVPSSVRPLSHIYQVQFEEEAFLGRGSYGDVYLGKRIDSGEPVAVKRIALTNRQGQETFIGRELRALNRIKHPNVVKLCDSNANERFLYLYLEFCEHGDLEKYLSDNDQLNDLDILHLIQQCAEAVLFMHTMRPNSIIHRDLKPANFLITTQDGHLQLKVADFGLCRELGASGASITATGVGTQEYMAPEVVMASTGRAHYGKAVDTFSLGIFFLSFINYTKDKGIVTIKVRDQPVGTWMHYLTRDGKPAYPPTTFSVHDASHITCLKALANQMIQQEPNDRISMNEVCNGISKIISDLGIENAVRVEHSTLTDFGFVFTKLASMDVGDIGENIRCGIGPFQGILVHNNANVVLYRIRDDDQLELCWRKEIPSGRSLNTLLSLDEDGQIYVQDELDTIHVYDSSLQYTGTVAARGRTCVSLCAGFRLYETVYVQPDGSNKVKFSLEHRDGRIVHTFRNREFSFSRVVLLGVAFDPIQGKTVLIDQEHRFCEIFDDAGSMQHHMDLDYIPGPPTCFGEQIMVPVCNEARVEFYSWSGTWICSLHHDQLGIPSDSKCRLFTPVSANKTILLVKDPSGNYSLHAYRVEKSPSSSVLNSVDMTSME